MALTPEEKKARKKTVSIPLLPTDAPKEADKPRTASVKAAAERVYAQRILARRRLLHFVTLTHPNYEPGWVHDDICQRLERFSQEVAAKKSPRLMLLMPPRHGKSELASIRFPSWHLGHHPHHEIINAGYNLDLPMIFSRKVRELARSAHYQAMFPDMQLDSTSQSVEAWNTTKGGGLTAAGVGGGITGKGAHVLIIDDPVKNQEEADNAEARNKLMDWYQSTAYTRLAPGGGVLVIQTCWNDDDLAGRLQNLAKTDPEADQFEVVKYPALSEEWEYRNTETFHIVRSPKELPPSPELTLLRPPETCLHEARYPTSALKRIKASGMSARIWSALYQQNPVPDSGMYFAAKDFRYYATPPDPFNLRVYTAWDFAIGEKKHNDWNVGFTVLQNERNVMYVLNIRRFKGDSMEIVNNILDEASRYTSIPSVDYLIGFEDGQIWKTLKPYLELRMQERKEFPSYEILSPFSDKMARARPLQGRMQQGMIYWPDPALYPWVNQAVTEMLRFPAGAHDDVVDGAAWAARMCVTHSPPQVAEPPKLKSWKDDLDNMSGQGLSAMAA